MNIKSYEEARDFLKKNDLGHQEWGAFGERLEGMFNQNIWIEAAYVRSDLTESDTVEVILRSRSDEESTILRDISGTRIKLSEFEWDLTDSFRVKTEVFQLLIMQLVLGFERA
jgi:hypothetical protein